VALNDTASGGHALDFALEFFDRRALGVDHSILRFEA
jgi:hypothetical protein